MDTKIIPVYMLSVRDHFRPRYRYTLNNEGWKKLFYAQGNKKKPGVAILI